MTNNVFIIFSLFFVDCGFSDDVLGDLGKLISRIHSNPVDRNRFSYEKTMSRIVLYPAFYEYKMCNHKIKLRGAEGTG